MQFVAFPYVAENRIDLLVEMSEIAPLLLTVIINIKKSG